MAITATQTASNNISADTIWDAAGDLAVGSGADTAVKLVLGADGTFLKSGATTRENAFPPGHELAYTEFTSPVTLASTSEATPTSIVSAGSVAFDGSTEVEIDLYAPYMQQAETAGQTATILLLADGTSIGRVFLFRSHDATNVGFNGVRVSRILTPANASITYSFAGFSSGGEHIIGAGAGGSGNYMPGFIRISKAS